MYFNISNHETKNRKDKDKNSGGLIEFVRKDFITKSRSCRPI